MIEEQKALHDRIGVYRHYLEAVKADVTAVRDASSATEIQWLRGIALALVTDLEAAQAALKPFATAKGVQLYIERVVKNYMGSGRDAQETRWQDITATNPAASYFANAAEKRDQLASRGAARSHRLVEVRGQRAN